MFALHKEILVKVRFPGLQKNKVISRTIFKSVAGRALEKVRYISGSKGFATGAKYYLNAVLNNKEKSVLKKEGIDVKALKRHPLTAIEKADGDFHVDHMATHSPSFLDKTTGLTSMHEKVGDGVMDFMGKNKPQFISIHPSIQATLSKETKLIENEAWKNFVEKYKPRDEQIKEKITIEIDKEIDKK